MVPCSSAADVRTAATSARQSASWSSSASPQPSPATAGLHAEAQIQSVIGVEGSGRDNASASGSPSLEATRGNQPTRAQFGTRMRAELRLFTAPADRPPFVAQAFSQDCGYHGPPTNVPPWWWSKVVTGTYQQVAAVRAAMLPLRIGMPLETDTTRYARVVQLVGNHGIEAHQVTVLSQPLSGPLLSTARPFDTGEIRLQETAFQPGSSLRARVSAAS